MTDEELDERLREAFAEARLPADKIAQLAAQAEPLAQRRGWERWVLGLAVAAALVLAAWPAVSDRLTPSGVSGAGLRGIETAVQETPYVPPLPIPDGQRAVLVPVAGLLGTQFTPGMTVDLLVTLVVDGVPETISMLEATLLAVDNERTARLAVSPSDAEKVAHAVNTGAVRLAAHTGERTRAMTVHVDAAELRSGFLVPRARVDVLVTLEQPDGRFATLTLLKGVQVMDTALTRAADGSLNGAATFSLGPEEAEQLAHATHLGKLSFTRR